MTMTMSVVDGLIFYNRSSRIPTTEPEMEVDAVDNNDDDDDVGGLSENDDDGDRVIEEDGDLEVEEREGKKKEYGLRPTEEKVGVGQEEISCDPKKKKGPGKTSEEKERSSFLISIFLK